MPNPQKGTQRYNEYIERVSNSVKSFYIKHPEAKDNLRIKCKTGLLLRLTSDKEELRRLRTMETHVGGFWYGNVYRKINHGKYCELWNEDLKERIRAYWYYVSALSGKPETSINTKRGLVRSICCHHVYYQKRACCIWDEDEKGYYANINVGTHNNPFIKRYYIEGDPNKFVTLTASEHKLIDNDKLYWIKEFEKLIEEQGGKSYFTKGEMDEYKEENTNT